MSTAEAERRAPIVGLWRSALAAVLLVGAVVVGAPSTVLAEVSGATPGTPRGAAATITAGGSHMCALLDNGTVKCWGNGIAGRLGNNDDTNIGDGTGPSVAASDPIDLGTGRTATAITAGDLHTCALLDNNTVKCWGNGSAGQLGNNDDTNIGDGTGPSVAASDPVDLGTGRTATAITAGGSHTCALLDNNTVKCWGNGSAGQLGNNDDTNIGDGTGPSVAASDPVDLGTGRTATAITAGGSHTCALLDNNTVKCWGNGSAGRLGTNATTNIGDGTGPSVAASDPVDLGTGRTPTAITAGGSHTCALLDNNTAKCWGDGDTGQLGNNDNTNIGDGTGPSVAASEPVGFQPPFEVQAQPAAAGPPAAIATSAGDARVELSWAAPIDDGGAPITGYRVEQSLDDGVTWSLATVSTDQSVSTSATVIGLINNAAYRFRVTAINDVGTSPPSLSSGRVTPTLPDPNPPSPGPNPPSPPTSPPTSPPPTTNDVGIVTVAPGRLLETRPNRTTIDGQQNSIGQRNAGQVTTVNVWNRAGVPTGATAALVNIGAVNPALQGFITAYPCNANQPDASTLNYTTGQTISNGALIALSNSGTLCIYTHRAMDLIVDVTGYTPADSVVDTNTPARLLETRSGLQTIDGRAEGIGRRSAGQVTTVQVTGRAGINNSATAAILNIATINPQLQGFITAYPCDAQRPDASTLNYTTGQTIANGGIFALSPTGTICIYTHRQMDLIVDVTGSIPNTNTVNTINPARYLETRPGRTTFDGQSQNIGPRNAGQITTLQIAGRGQIPNNATSAILNIAAINPALQGFITIYPCNVTQPDASTLNYAADQTIANNAVIALSPTGTICIYTHRQMDLIIDITGWT